MQTRVAKTKLRRMFFFAASRQTFKKFAKKIGEVAKNRGFAAVPAKARVAARVRPRRVAKIGPRQLFSVGGYDVRGFIVLLGCVSTSA
jgi:hypothetical protein